MTVSEGVISSPRGGGRAGSPPLNPPLEENDTPTDLLKWRQCILHTMDGNK